MGDGNNRNVSKTARTLGDNHNFCATTFSCTLYFYFALTYVYIAYVHIHCIINSVQKKRINYNLDTQMTSGRTHGIT